MIWVELTWAEVKMATTVGITRQIASLQDGRTSVAKMEEVLGWSNNIEGACGEMVVAKALGVYYDGHVNEFTRSVGDVDGWEIRTRSRHNYDLLVRPRDSEDKRYLLVTGVAPKYCIRGWAYGHEAKQEKWLKAYTTNRPDAYFMPQRELHDFEITDSSK